MTDSGVDDGSGVLRSAWECDAQRWLEMLRDPDCVTFASPAHVPIPAKPAELGDRILESQSAWAEKSPCVLVVARVQLDHSVENAASCRVALAAGFEREGVRRAFLPLRDPAGPGGVRRHDVCLHGKIRDDPVHDEEEHR